MNIQHLYSTQNLDEYRYYSSELSQNLTSPFEYNSNIVLFRLQPGMSDPSKQRQSYSQNSEFGIFSSGNTHEGQYLHSNPLNYNDADNMEPFDSQFDNNEDSGAFGQGVYSYGYDDNYNISPFNNIAQNEDEQFEFGNEPSNANEMQNISHMFGHFQIGSNANTNKRESVKDDKKRRKSSSIDLLDDVGQFHEHIEEQLKNIPIDNSPKDLKSTISKTVDNKEKLKNTLTKKKSSAPYKPKNYKPTHLSPSPRRNYQMADFPVNQRSIQDYPTQDPYGYYTSEQDYGFTHHSNMAHAYSNQMHYDAYPQNPGYNPNAHYMVHAGYSNPQMTPVSYSGYPQMQNVQHMGYNPAMRESYSPDVKKSYYLMNPSLLDHAPSAPQFPNYSWDDYSPSHQQTVVPQNQFVPAVVSAPAQTNEIKMNFAQYDESPALVQRTSSNNTDQSDYQNNSDGSSGLNTSGEAAANKNKNSTLTPESCLQLAKDQSGCRMLQKRLEEGDEEEHANLYNLIRPNFVELMNNSFGNYLCQKITEKCSKSQLKDIIQIISEDVVSIC